MLKMINFNQLPPFSKNLITAGAIAAGIFGFFKIRKSLKKEEEKSAADQSVNAAINQAKETDQEIKKLVSAGKKPTLPLSEFYQLTNKLLEAMRGAGTDERKIFSVYTALGNNLDFLLLNKSFGIKEYRYGPLMTHPMNLSQWIQTELNSNEINTLNLILAKKGINYRY